MIVRFSVFKKACLSAASLLCLLQGQAYANDLLRAPTPFALNGDFAVPVDLQSVDVSYVFDVDVKKGFASAVVKFKTGVREGFPIIDLIPDPKTVHLDGDTLDTSLYSNVSSPGNVTTLRVLKTNLEADSTHTLEVSYELVGEDVVSFSTNSVAFGTFMSDLDDRLFMEQFAPTNLEFDQYASSMSIKVQGASAAEHEIFANGAVTEKAVNEWSIQFPSYFTTSSPYLHLVKKGRFVSSTVMHNTGSKVVPVTVYTKSDALTKEAMGYTKKVLNELDSLFGPTIHDKFVVFGNQGEGGGMEHCGATIAEISDYVIGHEITHSYFARGVMPANGSAGWIDEAIASWRDGNFQRRNFTNRTPVNLSNYSDYMRLTKRAAYTLGKMFIEELDGATASLGGMKLVLKKVYENYQKQPITIDMFKDAVEKLTNMTFSAQFDRYVFGKGQLFEEQHDLSDASMTSMSGHPRPFTREELKRLR